MQYLLTAEEMAAINAERAEYRKLPNANLTDHLLALKNVCQSVATRMFQPDTMEPHGCVHVKDPRGAGWQCPYCDGCPVAGICPQPKEWSK